MTTRSRNYAKLRFFPENQASPCRKTSAPVRRLPVRFPPPQIGRGATLFSVPFRRGTGWAGGRRPVSEKSPGKMERPCVRCAATGSGAEHVAGMTRGENPESGNGPGACGGVRSRACSGFAVSLLRRNGASALSVSEIGRGAGPSPSDFPTGPSGDAANAASGANTKRPPRRSVRNPNNG